MAAATGAGGRVLGRVGRPSAHHGPPGRLAGQGSPAATHTEHEVVPPHVAIAVIGHDAVPAVPRVFASIASALAAHPAIVATVDGSDDGSVDGTDDAMASAGMSFHFSLQVHRAPVMTGRASAGLSAVARLLDDPIFPASHILLLPADLALAESDAVEHLLRRAEEGRAASAVAVPRRFDRIEDLWGAAAAARSDDLRRAGAAAFRQADVDLGASHAVCLRVDVARHLLNLPVVAQAHEEWPAELILTCCGMAQPEVPFVYTALAGAPYRGAPLTIEQLDVEALSRLRLAAAALAKPLEAMTLHMRRI